MRSKDVGERSTATSDLIDDPDPQVREMAARALRAIGTPEALDAVRGVPVPEPPKPRHRRWAFSWSLGGKRCCA